MKLHSYSPPHQGFTIQRACPNFLIIYHFDIIEFSMKKLFKIQKKLYHRSKLTMRGFFAPIVKYKNWGKNPNFIKII
jgi:hypothetical protein